MINDNQIRISSCLRFPQLRAMVGLSRATIWRLEHRGQFPKRRKISPGAVGWLREEVDTWLKERATV